MRRDVTDLYDARERDMARRLARLPVCEWCRQPIQGEYRWRINGDLICEHCIEECREWNEEEE